MIYRISIKSMAALLAAASLAACGNSDNGSVPDAAVQAGPAEAVDVSAQPELTREQAIAKVKALADSGAIKATIYRRYSESRTEQQVCSDTEVAYQQSAYPNNPELWRCKSSTGAPPFRKSMPVSESKCCKSERVLIPSNASWDATLSPDDGLWRVTADFGIGSTRHHAIWTLETKTDKIDEVTPPPS
jgi:predicted small lipoprotein YifL